MIESTEELDWARLLKFAVFGLLGYLLLGGLFTLVAVVLP